MYGATHPLTPCTEGKEHTMPQQNERKQKNEKDKGKNRRSASQNRGGTSDKKPSGTKPKDWKNVPGNQS